MTKLNVAVNAAAALIAEAARIGAETKILIETSESAQKTRLEHLGSARDSVEQDKKDNMGFATPRFRAYGRVGHAFGSAFNDLDSQAARDTIKGVAVNFLINMTGKNESTFKGGGAVTNAQAVIALGHNTERLRAAVQSRLDFWMEQRDNAEKLEAADAKVQRELALRYLQPTGATPNADGSLKVDEKGKPITPKHNGRPAVTVRGVSIPYGSSTNRESQFAFLARLFAQYGDVVLDSEVLDASLDNGGRYAMDKDTVPSVATKALEAVENLLMIGGNVSGDAAHLTLFASLLSRIANEGFKAQHIAPDVDMGDDAADSDVGTESAPETKGAEPDLLDTLVDEAIAKGDEVLTQDAANVVKAEEKAEEKVEIPAPTPRRRAPRRGGAL